MHMAISLGQHRLPLILLMIFGVLATGCSLSSPSGGDSQTETFEGAPTVRIFSPLPNQTFLEGTTVNIQARVENAGADVASVTIYLDDAIVGQVDDPNQSGAAAFSITQDWLTSTQGQYEIAVIATRSDGTASDRETVSVSVIKQADIGGDSSTANQTPDDTSDEDDTTTADSQTTDNTNTMSGSTTNQQTTTSATNTPGPTNTPAPPTNTPEPTATFTPSVPMARVISGANLRRGPSTVFEPPAGSIAANQEAEIVGVNPAGDWYKIRYFNSTAWIFGSLVETTGNLSSLPVDAGPPTPIPATATPIPTETPIPSQVNLIVTNIAIDPHPLKCQEASEITVTVTNNGSADTQSGGKIRIEAVLVSTGAVLETTETVFGVIPAGGTASASAFISVGTNFDELQRIRATVDSDNQITESNEGDNSTDQGTDYSLRKGSCV